MNPNPYRNDVESIVFRDWESEYRSVVAERDYLEDRISALQLRLERAQLDLLGSMAFNVCIVPTCNERRGEHANMLRLCEGHMAAAWRDMETTWRERFKTNPEKVPQGVRARLGTGPTPWVVYYIRFGENVKIGRTTNLARRMREFCSVQDQLLAVEPGVVVDGVDRERQRHTEYADIRLPGTELFTLNDALQQHIDMVVATFGDPQQYLTPEAA